MTQNLILQTKKRPHNVKSVKTLGFYYKLRVGELARALGPQGRFACKEWSRGGLSRLSIALAQTPSNSPYLRGEICGS